MEHGTMEPAADDALAALVRERCAAAPLRIGTRTSPMALAQAQHVKALVEKRVPGVAVEIVGMETSADLWKGDLARLGGKGNFTKEIDRALIDARVDVAVHCLKDVPGDVPLPAGTEFAAHLERTDVHDVAVFPAGSRTPLWHSCRPARSWAPRPSDAAPCSADTGPTCASRACAATSTRAWPGSTRPGPSPRWSSPGSGWPGSG